MSTPDIAARCTQLLERGQLFARRIRNNQYGPEYWFDARDVPDGHAWIASVANFFAFTAIPGSYFTDEVRRIVEQGELKGGVPLHAIQKLIGLLASISDEMQNGLLRKVEYIFVASTFDDFLTHAADFHRAGKKTESSVLCSAQVG